MTQEEYFKQNRHVAKYLIGERVQGKWNKIPFVGTVLVENLVSEVEGPRLMVYVDLPIKYKNDWHYVIKLNPKDAKYFK